MAVSERLLAHVAKDLGLSKDELLVGSLLEYLKSKKRDCMAEKLEILSRYRNISTSKELEEAIKNGMVVEHPSWEDLIGIENLEDKIKKLDKEIESIAGLLGT